MPVFVYLVDCEIVTVPLFELQDDLDDVLDIEDVCDVVMDSFDVADTQTDDESDETRDAVT